MQIQNYKPISIKLHAINDLVSLLFVLISPWLLGFSDNSPATLYAIAMFAGGMALNLASDYPLGLMKLIPMKWHRRIEFTTPGIFIAGPWLFFADAGWMPWALTAAGVMIVLNSALTREVKS